MDFAINLWNKNKWLFFLAIPLVLIFVFKDVIMALLISNVKKTVDNAEKKDQPLAQAEEELKDKAAQAKQQADDIAENINGRKEDDISNDWYKKR